VIEERRPPVDERRPPIEERNPSTEAKQSPREESLPSSSKRPLSEVLNRPNNRLVSDQKDRLRALLNPVNRGQTQDRPKPPVEASTKQTKDTTEDRGRRIGLPTRKRPQFVPPRGRGRPSPTTTTPRDVPEATTTATSMDPLKLLESLVQKGEQKEKEEKAFKKVIDAANAIGSVSRGEEEEPKAEEKPKTRVTVETSVSSSVSRAAVRAFAKATPNPPSTPPARIDPPSPRTTTRRPTEAATTPSRRPVTTTDREEEIPSAITEATTPRAQRPSRPRGGLPGRRPRPPFGRPRDESNENDIEDEIARSEEEQEGRGFKKPRRVGQNSRPKPAEEEVRSSGRPAFRSNRIGLPPRRQPASTAEPLTPEPGVLLIEEVTTTTRRTPPRPKFNGRPGGASRAGNRPSDNDRRGGNNNNRPVRPVFQRPSNPPAAKTAAETEQAERPLTQAEKTSQTAARNNLLQLLAKKRPGDDRSAVRPAARPFDRTTSRPAAPASSQMSPLENLFNIATQEKQKQPSAGSGPPRRKKKKKKLRVTPGILDLSPEERIMNKVKETLNQPAAAGSENPPAPAEDEGSRRKVIVRKKKHGAPRTGKSLLEEMSKLKHVKVRVRRPRPHLPTTH